MCVCQCLCAHACTNFIVFIFVIAEPCCQEIASSITWWEQKTICDQRQCHCYHCLQWCGKTCQYPNQNIGPLVNERNWYNMYMWIYTQKVTTKPWEKLIILLKYSPGFAFFLPTLMFQIIKKYMLIWLKDNLIKYKRCVY